MRGDRGAAQRRAIRIRRRRRAAAILHRPGISPPAVPMPLGPPASSRSSVRSRSSAPAERSSRSGALTAPSSLCSPRPGRPHVGCGAPSGSSSPPSVPPRPSVPSAEQRPCPQPALGCRVPGPLNNAEAWAGPSPRGAEPFPLGRAGGDTAVPGQTLRYPNGEARTGFAFLRNCLGFYFVLSF